MPTVAALARVKQIGIQLLNANRLAYSSTVGTGTAGIGAFAFDNELTDHALAADALVINEGYFQTNLSLRNRFLTISANLGSGARLPEFVGVIGKVEYSLDSTNWKDSEEALTKQDVVGAVNLGSYVGEEAFYGKHFIDDVYIFHTSPYLRCEYPNYTRTTALQALEAHESAIVAGFMMLCYKNNSNAGHDYYAKIFYDLLERIKAGSLRMASYMPKPLPLEMRGR